MPRDPYADLAQAYAEETSMRRARSPVTEKANIEGHDYDVFSEVPEVPFYRGFHIDGDPRYQER